MSIRIDRVVDLDDGVEQVLARHHALMRESSPEESCHVMTADALTKAGARVYAARNDAGSVCAVGALKMLDPKRVELKSMHTLEHHRGKGLARRLLQHLLSEARGFGAREALLETGTAPLFAPARALYRAEGFVECPPFGAYRVDPLSAYMQRSLA